MFLITLLGGDGCVESRTATNNPVMVLSHTFLFFLAQICLDGLRCPQPLAQMMHQCWHTTPESRPPTAFLVETLEKLC